jgi:hypothetical protein
MSPHITALAGDNQEKSQPLFSSPRLILFSKSLYFLTLYLSCKSLCYLSIITLSEGELHEDSDFCWVRLVVS